MAGVGGTVLPGLGPWWAHSWDLAGALAFSALLQILLWRFAFV